MESPKGRRGGQETLDVETDQKSGGTDRGQAARGRHDARGGEPEPITLGEEPGLEGGIGNPEPLPELPPQERSYWRHREFIWGPEYVDELILQQEVRPEGSGGPAHGPAVYAITNLGFDVVALADAAGSVLRQYVYDPYGQVIEAGSLADHAPNRVGHKGLFFQRLDAPAQGPHLVGGAVGVYHCRNRELRPDLQRWMQQDPNGTGQVVLDVAAMHGGGFVPAASLASAGAMFTDGVHLAGYLGQSPIRRADPVGLEWSYGNLVATMGIQGTIQGAMGGTLNAINGGSFGGGFAVGFVAGALGGAGAFAANTAFAASASGLWATLGAHALVGAADGAIAAGVESYLTHQDARTALADAMWGAVLGTMTAGTFSGVHWIRGADDVVLEGAGAFASRGSTGRASPGSLREMLALAQARANPQAGRRMNIEMSDPRWPAAEGWEKRFIDIQGVQIHYVYNPRLGAADDFKFK